MRGGKRTSLTVDKLVADLFCVSLGCNHDAEEANKIVTAGIQKIIDKGKGGTIYKSKMIQDLIIIQLIKDNIRIDWLEHQKNNKEAP